MLFAFQLLFGRFYGPQIFGYSNTAQAGLQVATMVGKTAGDTVVFRGLAQPESPATAIDHGVTLSVFGGVVAGLALMIWGILAPVEAESSRAAFLLAAAAVPIASALFPLGAVLRHEKRFAMYALITTLLEPTVRFAVLLAAALLGANWLWVMAGFPLAAAAAMLAAVMVLRSMLRGRTAGIHPEERLALITFSTETTIASALQASMFFVALTVAATVTNAVDVGRFAAAVRIGMLALLIQTAYATSFLPLVPGLLASSDRGKELRALYQRVTTAVLWVNAPLLIGLAAGAEGIMGFFGSEFTPGAILLGIVTIGQCVNSATALAEDFLPLAGRSRLALINNLAALLLMTIGAYFLGRWLGITGVALGYAIAMGLLNAVRAYQIHRMLNIAVPYAMALKTVLAGGIVLAVWFMIAVRCHVGGEQSLIGSVLCSLATVGVLYLLSDSSQRETLRALVHPRAVLVRHPASK